MSLIKNAREPINESKIHIVRRISTQIIAADIIPKNVNTCTFCHSETITITIIYRGAAKSRDDTLPDINEAKYVFHTLSGLTKI